MAELKADLPWLPCNGCNFSPQQTPETFAGRELDGRTDNFTNPKFVPAITNYKHWGRNWGLGVERNSDRIRLLTLTPVNWLLPVTDYGIMSSSATNFLCTLNTEITQVPQYRRRGRDKGSTSEWFPVAELGGKWWWGESFQKQRVRKREMELGRGEVGKLKWRDRPRENKTQGVIFFRDRIATVVSNWDRPIKFGL